MDKRTFLAIALSLAVLGLWEIFVAPRLRPGDPNLAVPGAAAVPGAKESPPETGGQAPSSSPAYTKTTNSGSPSTHDKPAGVVSELSRQTAPRRESPAGAPPVIVETAFAHIEIERVGGRIRSWTLKKYKDHEGNPYELVSPDSRRSGIYPLQFKVQDKSLEEQLNSHASFDVERRGASPSAEPPSSASASNLNEVPRQDLPAPPHAGPERAKLGGEEVRLIFSDGHGLDATKTLAFFEDSYLVELSAEIHKDGQSIPGKILWGPGIGTPSADDLKNARYDGGGAIADSGTGTARLTAHQIAGSTQRFEDVRWTGVEEKYFASVFIPTERTTAEVFAISVPASPAPGQQGDSSQKTESKTQFRVSVGVPLGEAYLFYAGPKDYGLLSSLNRGLTDLVNFKSGPTLPLIGSLINPLVEILAKVLLAALRWLHTYIPNFGVDIIILTAVIKIAFYPITQRTMVKMRGEQKKMQRVQPKVNAIKEKYRKLKDAAGRAKMNEEVMALYKREGINPMASLGGCLPMLVQLPILWAFFQVLNVSIELRQAPFFGWIQDLPRPDRLGIGGQGIPVTPILMGVSMFLQQKLAMTNVTDPQQRMQQRMMLIMPILFTWFFINLPSGLVIYWLVSNVLGIVQQVLINRQARAIEAREVAAVGKA